MSPKHTTHPKETLIAFRLDAAQVATLDAYLATLKVPATLGLSRSELARHALLELASKNQPAKRPRKE